MWYDYSHVDTHLSARPSEENTVSETYPEYATVYRAPSRKANVIGLVLSLVLIPVLLYVVPGYLGLRLRSDQLFDAFDVYNLALMAASSLVLYNLLRIARMSKEWARALVLGLVVASLLMYVKFSAPFIVGANNDVPVIYVLLASALCTPLIYNLIRGCTFNVLPAVLTVIVIFLISATNLWLVHGFDDLLALRHAVQF